MSGEFAEIANTKNESPFTLIKEKIIYPSRNGITKNELAEILNLEIQWLLNKNPEYEFAKFGDKIYNRDMSISHFIILTKKPAAK